MKIVLSLVLIAVGVYGLISEHKRHSKEKKEILKRLIANHIIAKDALNRLSAEEKMSSEDYCDSIKHLTDNTIEIVVKACGTKYVVDADWLIKKYGKEDGKATC